MATKTTQQTTPSQQKPLIIALDAEYKLLNEASILSDAKLAPTWAKVVEALVKMSPQTKAADGKPTRAVSQDVYKRETVAFAVSRLKLYGFAATDLTISDKLTIGLTATGKNHAKAGLFEDIKSDARKAWRMGLMRNLNGATLPKQNAGGGGSKSTSASANGNGATANVPGFDVPVATAQSTITELHERVTRFIVAHSIKLDVGAREELGKIGEVANKLAVMFKAEWKPKVNEAGDGKPGEQPQGEQPQQPQA